MRKICVVGLGYVGLPLALAFGKKQKVHGFDINEKRICELNKKIDCSGECSKEDFENSNVEFSSDPAVLKSCDFIIVAVPTPIDNVKKPDTKYLENACEIISKNLSKGTIIVFESTVYPGVTENICTPILEKYSILKHGTDFKTGYSPERINPGDKEHCLENITKIVAGSDEEALNTISETYSTIIKAGIYKAKTIKTAEAAKVIENIQRDINIALINELKIIFDKMNIDVHEVIEAASTKWNFIKFTPGLVGGHCIGVDPFYLAYEAERIGHHPEIILAGRRINDNMAKYEANRIIKKIIEKEISVKNLKILILGATFKPDVKDLRNSKVKDFADELKEFGCNIKFCEPNIDKNKIFDYDNTNIEEALKEGFNTAIYAVKHKIFEKNKEKNKENFKLFFNLFQ